MPRNNMNNVEAEEIDLDKLSGSSRGDFTISADKAPDKAKRCVRGSVNVASIDGIPDWLRNALQKLDTDGNGLEKDEVETMLDCLAKQEKAKEQNVGELDYSNMPDKVKEALSFWDKDGGGSVSVAELMAAAEAQKEMERQNRLMKKALIAICVLVVIGCGAMFSMAYSAVEAAKDSRPASASSSSRRARQLKEEFYFAQYGIHPTTAFGTTSRSLLALTSYEADNGQGDSSWLANFMATGIKGRSLQEYEYADPEQTMDEDAQEPGTYYNSDGSRQGTALAKKEIVGAEIMEMMKTLNKETMKQVVAANIQTKNGAFVLQGIGNTFVVHHEKKGKKVLQFRGEEQELRFVESKQRGGKKTYRLRCCKKNAGGKKRKKWTCVRGFPEGLPAKNLRKPALPGKRMRDGAPDPFPTDAVLSILEIRASTLDAPDVPEENRPARDDFCGPAGCSPENLGQMAALNGGSAANADYAEVIPVGADRCPANVRRSLLAHFAARGSSAAASENHLVSVGGRQEAKEKMMRRKLRGRRFLTRRLAAVGIDTKSESSRAVQRSLQPSSEEGMSMIDYLDCNANGLIDEFEQVTEGFCHHQLVDMALMRNPRVQGFFTEKDWSLNMFDESAYANPDLFFGNLETAKHAITMRMDETGAHRFLTCANVEVVVQLACEYKFRELCFPNEDDAHEDAANGVPGASPAIRMLQAATTRPPMRPERDENEGYQFVAKMIVDGDKDRNGCISEEEFIELVMRGNTDPAALDEHEEKEPSAPQGVEKACGFFDGKQIEHPSQLRGPLVPADTRANPEALGMLFVQMDGNVDGVVTLKECTRFGGQGAQDEFHRMCASTSGECGGMATPEAFVEQRSQEGAELTAQMEFELRDTSGDGMLSAQEYAADLKNSMAAHEHPEFAGVHDPNSVMAHPEDGVTAGNAVRRLQEKLVHEPRRLRRDRRLAQREQRVRRLMQRRLGIVDVMGFSPSSSVAAGDSSSAGAVVVRVDQRRLLQKDAFSQYDAWLARRQAEAASAVEPVQRRLEELHEEERQRRQLQREDGAAPCDVYQNTYERIRTHDDFQAMDEEVLERTAESLATAISQDGMESRAHELIVDAFHVIERQTCFEATDVPVAGAAREYVRPATSTSRRKLLEKPAFEGKYEVAGVIRRVLQTEQCTSFSARDERVFMTLERPETVLAVGRMFEENTHDHSNVERRRNANQGDPNPRTPFQRCDTAAESFGTYAGCPYSHGNNENVRKARALLEAVVGRRERRQLEEVENRRRRLSEESTKNNIEEQKRLDRELKESEATLRKLQAQARTLTAAEQAYESPVLAGHEVECFYDALNYTPEQRRGSAERTHQRLVTGAAQMDRAIARVRRQLLEEDDGLSSEEEIELRRKLETFDERMDYMPETYGLPYETCITPCEAFAEMAPMQVRGPGSNIPGAREMRDNGDVDWCAPAQNYRREVEYVMEAFEERGGVTLDAGSGRTIPNEAPVWPTGEDAERDMVTTTITWSTTWEPLPEFRADADMPDQMVMGGDMNEGPVMNVMPEHDPYVMSFEDWAQGQMYRSKEEPGSIRACTELPEAEKWLPINYEWDDRAMKMRSEFSLDQSMFPDAWANSDEDLPGAGCLHECGCVAAGMTTESCHEIPGLLENCRCMKNKRECFHNLFRNWDHAGGVKDVCGEMPPHRRRLQQAKHIREVRRRSLRVSKLLPSDRKAVFRQLKTEEHRRTLLLRQLQMEESLKPLESLDKEENLSTSAYHAERQRRLEAYGFATPEHAERASQNALEFRFEDRDLVDMKLEPSPRLLQQHPGLFRKLFEKRRRLQEQRRALSSAGRALQDYDSFYDFEETEPTPCTTYGMICECLDVGSPDCIGGFTSASMHQLNEDPYHHHIVAESCDPAPPIQHQREALHEECEGRSWPDGCSEAFERSIEDAWDDDMGYFDVHMLEPELQMWYHEMFHHGPPAEFQHDYMAMYNMEQHPPDFVDYSNAQRMYPPTGPMYDGMDAYGARRFLQETFSAGGPDEHMSCMDDHISVEEAHRGDPMDMVFDSINTVGGSPGSENLRSQTVDEYVKKCEQGDEDTMPEVCGKAKEGMAMLHAFCAGAVEGFFFTRENFKSFVSGMEDFEHMEPGPEGTISPGKYQCYAAMHHDMDRAEAAAEFEHRTEGGAGEGGMTMEDWLAPNGPLDSLRHLISGCVGMDERERQDHEMMAAARHNEYANNGTVVAHELSHYLQGAMMSAAHYSMDEETDFASTDAEMLDTVVSGVPPMFDEYNEDTRDDLSALMGTSGMGIDFLEMALDSLAKKNDTIWYEHEQLDRDLAFGSQNFTDPVVLSNAITQPHEMLARRDRLEHHRTALEDAINLLNDTMIPSLRTAEHTAMATCGGTPAASDYCGTAYVPPSVSSESATDRDIIADGLMAVLDTETSPQVKGRTVDAEMFMGLIDYHIDSPEESNYMLEEAWMEHSESGCGAPDAFGMMPESAMQCEPDPFNSFHDTSYSMYDDFYYEPLLNAGSDADMYGYSMSIGVSRRVLRGVSGLPGKRGRTVSFLPDVQVDWDHFRAHVGPRSLDESRRMLQASEASKGWALSTGHCARNNVHFSDGTCNTALQPMEAGTRLSREDARMLDSASGNCAPHESTFEEFVDTIEAMAHDGAESGDRHIADFNAGVEAWRSRASEQGESWAGGSGYGRALTSSAGDAGAMIGREAFQKMQEGMRQAAEEKRGSCEPGRPCDGQRDEKHVPEEVVGRIWSMLVAPGERCLAMPIPPEVDVWTKYPESDLTMVLDPGNDGATNIAGSDTGLIAQPMNYPHLALEAQTIQKRLRTVEHELTTVLLDRKVNRDTVCSARRRVRRRHLQSLEDDRKLFGTPRTRRMLYTEKVTSPAGVVSAVAKEADLETSSYLDGLIGHPDVRRLLHLQQDLFDNSGRRVLQGRVLQGDGESEEYMMDPITASRQDTVGDFVLNALNSTSADFNGDFCDSVYQTSDEDEFQHMRPSEIRDMDMNLVPAPVKSFMREMATEYDARRDQGRMAQFHPSNVKQIIRDGALPKDYDDGIVERMHAPVREATCRTGGEACCQVRRLTATSAEGDQDLFAECYSRALQRAGPSQFVMDKLRDVVRGGTEGGLRRVAEQMAGRVDASTGVPQEYCGDWDMSSVTSTERRDFFADSSECYEYCAFADARGATAAASGRPAICTGTDADSVTPAMRCERLRACGDQRQRNEAIFAEINDRRLTELDSNRRRLQAVKEERRQLAQDGTTEAVQEDALADHWALTGLTHVVPVLPRPRSLREAENRGVRHRRELRRARRQLLAQENGEQATESVSTSSLSLKSTKSKRSTPARRKLRERRWRRNRKENVVRDANKRRRMRGKHSARGRTRNLSARKLLSSASRRRMTMRTRRP